MSYLLPLCSSLKALPAAGPAVKPRPGSPSILPAQALTRQDSTSWVSDVEHPANRGRTGLQMRVGHISQTSVELRIMGQSTDLASYIPHHSSLGDVRINVIGDEPWFVATDIAQILGITDVTRVTQRLDADERRKVDVETPTGARTMVIVSEPGMYRMVLTSRSKAADDLRRWLTHSVLPSIRKHGAYLTQKLSDEIAEQLDHQDRCTDQALYEMSTGQLDSAALHLSQARISQDTLNKLIGREPLPITRGCADRIRNPVVLKALGLPATRKTEIGPADGDPLPTASTYRYPAQYAS